MTSRQFRILLVAAVLGLGPTVGCSSPPHRDEDVERILVPASASRVLYCWPKEEAASEAIPLLESLGVEPSAGATGRSGDGVFPSGVLVRWHAAEDDLYLRVGVFASGEGQGESEDQGEAREALRALAVRFSTGKSDTDAGPVSACALIDRDGLFDALFDAVRREGARAGTGTVSQDPIQGGTAYSLVTDDARRLWRVALTPRVDSVVVEVTMPEQEPVLGDECQELLSRILESALGRPVQFVSADP